MDNLSQEIIIVVIGAAFFLLVAVGIIILLLIYQKKQLQYILEKQELKNQFQRELLKTRIEAQEETLNHVGRELHDNVGQLMSSSKLLVNVANRELPAPLETLQLADETICKAIQELRALSKSLNKEWLEKFNFIDNLIAEANRINASKEFVMTLVHPDEVNMGREKQLILFRVVQEAFQNSIKHGKAQHIKIEVKQNETAIDIAVEDNGKGFDATDTLLHGVGMTNIKNRATMMGGTVKWKSGGAGTLVAIQIPLCA